LVPSIGSFKKLLENVPGKGIFSRSFIRLRERILCKGSCVRFLHRALLGSSVRLFYEALSYGS
jgi:hypothetical protein